MPRASSLLTALTLIAGVAVGITIVASMPRLAAESATPCAWLPAEHATTPRRSCSPESCEILLYAPRILNECTECTSSRLSRIVLPISAESVSAFSSGVSFTISYTRALRILPR